MNKRLLRNIVSLGSLRGILTVCALLLALGVQAQTRVAGRLVAGEDGTPLPGVNVVIKGTTQGTITDADGRYNINVPNADAILVFSFVGYETQEAAVAGRSSVDITLATDAKHLSEVVVTALGVEKDLSSVGYAVQEVKGEDLVMARDQNPVTGLTGKIAGLSVGPSAEMLRKPTVLLRGNEISLYVVDGVPISSDTWNISPDDIETYTVLKGPTAAALYGSRAQYGAILITTKKGDKNKGFTVDFNSSNMVDNGFLAFPRLQDEYGAGANGLYRFGDGKGGGLNDNDYDVWGPRFEGQLVPQYDSPVDPVTGVRAGTPYVARGKDNLKRFLRPGFQSTNNVALSASGDNYSMRFSASHSYQSAIIPNMSLNITNFNMYGSYKPVERLKIEANLNYNKQYTPNFPDVDYGPNSLIYNVGIWTGADWDVESPDIRGIWQPGKVGTQSVFAEYQRYHNPWFMVKEWTRGHYKSDIYGYLSANYKLNDHLDVTARTQITTYNLFRNEKMPFSAHPYGREQGLGDYREDRRDMFENNTEARLNFDYKVGSFFGFSGFAGGYLRSFTYNSSYTSTDYLNVPNVYSFSNSRNNLIASSFTSDMRVLSGYYSLDVALGQYATVSTTGRVDKSSALPKGRNSFFYPSFSVASVISDYVKLPDVISFLKVRGSYAAVHGDATTDQIGMTPFLNNSINDYALGYGNNYKSPYGGPDYSLISAYAIKKVYNNLPATYYTTNLYDPNIKPFNRVNFEEGFDIRFFNNRIGASVTAFQYVDGPRILANPISPASGYDVYYLNALKTKKTGLEVTLTGTPIRTTSGLTWDVLVNWSTYQDRYAELPAGQTVYNTFFKKGDRVDRLYSSAFVKDQSGNIVHDNAGKPLRTPVNQFLGNMNADYSWAINNKVSYKHLSLSFQFDGRVGGVMTDYMHNKTMRGGRNIETVQGKYGEARYSDYQNATNAAYPGIFVGDGVVVSNGVPINFDGTTGEVLNYNELQFAPNTQVSKIQGYISSYYDVSEANLMSKTYAKLREVTIGYTLPSNLLKNTFIKRATVSVVGRNLIYFYKDKRFKDVDLDQYNAATSETALQSPTTRRYGLNINLTF